MLLEGRSPYRWWHKRAASAIVEDTLTEYLFSALVSRPENCERFFEVLRESHKRVQLPKAESASFEPWPSWSLPETPEGKKLGKAICKSSLEPDVLLVSKHWRLVVECEMSHFSADPKQMVDQYAAAKLIYPEPVFQLLVSEGAPVRFRQDIEDHLGKLEKACPKLGLSADDLYSRFLWIGWRTVAGDVLKPVPGLGRGAWDLAAEAFDLLEYEGLGPLPQVQDILGKIVSNMKTIQKLIEVLTANRAPQGAINRFLDWRNAPANKGLLDGLRRPGTVDVRQLPRALQHLNDSPDLVAWPRCAN